MSAELYYLIAFLLGTVLVIAITPIVKRVGMATGQVDQPDSRKIHKTPIVRIGGVSIFLASLITLGGLTAVGGLDFLTAAEVKSLVGVTLGGCAFFLMGFADDVFDLSPFKRLGLQFLTTSALWAQGLQIDFNFLPGNQTLLIQGLSLLVTFLWLAGVANAINWLDGMDGLAAGVSGTIALGILFVTLENGNNGVALLMAILAGSAIAFLWYNFHPATIFMGDGGSNFLGFMLAGASLLGIANEPGFNQTLAPFVFLAIPVGDMLAVIGTRLRNQRSPFFADQIHIHHRLLDQGWSQTLSALFIYSLTLWSVTLGLMICGLEQSWIYFAPATILVLGMTWQLQRSRKVEKKE